MRTLLVLLLLTSNAMARDWDISKDPLKSWAQPKTQKQKTCHDEDVYENGKYVKTITVCS